MSNVQIAKFLCKLFVSFSAFGGLCWGALAELVYRAELIFEPDKVEHGHTHASCLVECSNGDLLACWYEGETDKSDDVHIEGARLVAGSNRWSETFLMADTPGLSDNNPCMVIDQQERLWLFYVTLLGAPENSWGSAFLRYKISTDYQNPGEQIRWATERDLPIKPRGLANAVEAIWHEKVERKRDNPIVGGYATRMLKRLEDPLACRLGWMTRAHPTVLPSGALLLPLASENFGVAMMATTSDCGETWSFSSIPHGLGVEQPTVVRLSDGTLVAYMRDATLAHRIRKSISRDGGMTWSRIENTELPNPGAGIEAVRLRNKHIVLIYNDTTRDRHRLAVSVSDDDGNTWKWTRHLEDQEGEGFGYPSLIQTRDGNLHATYSYNVCSIKHAMFNEAWIMSPE